MTVLSTSYCEKSANYEEDFKKIWSVKNKRSKISMYPPSHLLCMWVSVQWDYVTRLQNSGCSVVIFVFSYADFIPESVDSISHGTIYHHTKVIASKVLKYVHLFKIMSAMCYFERQYFTVIILKESLKQVSESQCLVLHGCAILGKLLNISVL